MSWSRILPFLIAAVLCPWVEGAKVASNRHLRAEGGVHQCPWTVTVTRPAGPNDQPTEDSLPFAVRDDNFNIVPGPDSTRLVVENNAAHHPFIYIEDLRNGKRRRLLEGGGSMPSWSPDGRRVACIVWKSRRQPYQLEIVDAASGVAVLADTSLAVTDYKLSPGSKMVAADGPALGTSLSVLSVVRVADGATTPVDTTIPLGGHEYSWSPDSRWLVFSRPTKLDSHEEVTAADLWITEVRRGAKCPLQKTPDRVESRPQWVGTKAIRCLPGPRQSHTADENRARVLELRNESAAPAQSVRSP